MPGMNDPPFPSLVFLWPALAVESASEFASAMAREFVNLAVGPQQPAARPQFATANKVALELTTGQLRDFSTAPHGMPTLICAPFALHHATIVDFAPGHSLVATLQRAGLTRLFVTDWRSATPEMRFLSIDSYLADLNVMVDELGGVVDLVGLCQGGWLALIYAARFPTKIRKLVVAGAPVDIAAGHSRLSDLARDTPLSIFEELVELGGGRILGAAIRKLWAPEVLDEEAIARVLQPADAIGSGAFRRLQARFRDWEQSTLDLPGAYYLQVVEQLFNENRLASGRFVALGRTIDLSVVRGPLYLLAARDDEIVAPQQIFATERFVSPRSTVRKAVAPCGHLGLFMGREILAHVWADIARWLRQPHAVGRIASGGRG
jgi:poly(3-hydroxybutyrate) depolymerase